MPKKKVSVSVEEAEADKVVSAIEAAETADGAEAVVPTVEDVQEPKIALSPEGKPSLTAPVDGKTCYYVWDNEGTFVKFFTVEQYNGEEFKYAKELADQHEGWTIS
jgi:hypothetical protein